MNSGILINYEAIVEMVKTGAVIARNEVTKQSPAALQGDCFVVKTFNYKALRKVLTPRNDSNSRLSRR